MKETYQQCKKCRCLMPLLSYFLSKEENQKIFEEDRLLCYDCYQKLNTNQHNTNQHYD